MREDKEQQAEARGRRLGAAGRLQIVQLLMAGTVEEAVFESLAETRTQQGSADERAKKALKGKGGKAGGKAGGKPSGKRPRAAEEPQDDGRQAATLNALKLLRGGEGEEPAEAEGSTSADA